MLHVKVFVGWIWPHLCSTGDQTWHYWRRSCYKWFLCCPQAHLWCAKGR